MIELVCTGMVELRPPTNVERAPATGNSKQTPVAATAVLPTAVAAAAALQIPVAAATALQIP